MSTPVAHRDKLPVKKTQTPVASALSAAFKLSYRIEWASKPINATPSTDPLLGLIALHQNLRWCHTKIVERTMGIHAVDAPDSVEGVLRNHRGARSQRIRCGRRAHGTGAGVPSSQRARGGRIAQGRRQECPHERELQAPCIAKEPCCQACHARESRGRRCPRPRAHTSEYMAASLLLASVGCTFFPNSKAVPRGLVRRASTRPTSSSILSKRPTKSYFMKSSPHTSTWMHPGTTAQRV